jgi:hypothetical protein
MIVLLDTIIVPDYFCDHDFCGLIFTFLQRQDSADLAERNPQSHAGEKLLVLPRFFLFNDHAS